MNYTKFAKEEVHPNAVEKGWWEKELPFMDVVALMHEELSEALREYRCDRPMVWYECELSKCRCGDKWCRFYENSGCRHQKRKPEGIAVELIDCLLRIFDWCSHCGTDIQKLCDESKSFSQVEFDSFTSFIATQHAKLSLALLRDLIDDVPTRDLHLAVCVNQISNWLTKNYSTDWEKLMLEKHEYNKTRSYRHGGKKA